MATIQEEAFFSLQAPIRRVSAPDVPYPVQMLEEAVHAQRRARARGHPQHHAGVGLSGEFEFKLPDIGEGLAEAEVAKWLVKVGDRVVEDQPVVEMMTDKAAVEIPSPGAGVVVEQRVAEGDVVKIGAVLYVLETDARIGGMHEQAAAAAQR